MNQNERFLVSSSVHIKLQMLRKLAKKNLDVPASSTQVKRMFSISGHFFNPKQKIFQCHKTFQSETEGHKTFRKISFIEVK